MRGILHKLLHIIFVTITASVVVVTLLFGAFMLPPVQRVMRDVVVERMKDALGVDVKIDNLVYFPFKTLGLTNVVVCGQDSVPMISVASAKVNVGLASLWRSRLILTSIVVDSLDIDIHNVGDTTLNISVFTADVDTTSSDRKIPIEIGYVQSNHGHVRYLNQEASDINFYLKDLIASDGNVSVDVRRMSLVDVGHGGLVATLKTKLTMEDGVCTATSLNSAFGESSIIANDIFVQMDSAKAVRANIENLRVCSNTLRTLGVDVPANIVANASGMVSGTEHKIEVTNLYVDDELNSNILADVRIDSYDDKEKMKIDVNCKSLSTSLADICRMSNSAVDPKYNSAIGTINASGRLHGPLDDINVRCAVETLLGAVKADGKVDLKPNNDIHFVGKLFSEGLQLAALTDGMAGFMSFDSDFEGQTGEAETSFAHVKGDLHDFTYNDYLYHDVIVDAMLEETQYSGLLNVSDPNGNLTVVGEYVTEGSEPQLMVTARVEDFYTGRTNITPDIDGCLNLSLRADFKGPDIDRAQGRLLVDGFSFVDSLRTAKADELSIEVAADMEYNKDIAIKSDHISGQMKGQFRYDDLYEELYGQFYSQANALLDKQPSRCKSKVMAEADLHYTNANQYVQFLSDKLSLEEEGNVTFSVNSDDHKARLNVDIGDIEYGEYKMKDLAGNVVSDSAGINMILSASKMRLPSVGTIGETKLSNVLNSNLMNTDLSWDDMGHGKIAGQLSLYTLFAKENGELTAYIDVDESPIILKGEEWTLHKSQLQVSDDKVVVDGFRFDRDDRFLTIAGKASANAEDTMHVGMNKIIIEDMLRPDPYERYALEGDLSASMDLVSLYDNPIVNSIVKIDRFSVDEDNLERLDLITQWSSERKNLDVDVSIVTGGKPRAHGTGYVDVAENFMNLDFDIDSLSIGFLKYYLKSSISRVKGTTSGALQLHGPLTDIGLDARLTVNKTDFTVLSTNVDYTFNNNDSVILSPTNMIFRSVDGKNPGIQVVDGYGNKGYFGGNITHHMFSGLYTKLYFLVDNMHVLNLTEKENPTYYGSVFAKGRLDITGVTSDINIGIKAQTCPNTTFSVLPMAKSDQRNNNYIQFKTETVVDDFGDAVATDDIDVEKLHSFVTADIEVDIMPSAHVEVVLDPRTDNKISATGAGKLQLIVDKSGRLVILGNYAIDEGIYNFSYANVISKRFIINQGGTITWDGEPFNPLIDIMATYKLKASLYDLVQNNVEGQDLTKRVPINCNLYLTERMADPNIRFKIELPSTMNFNQYAIDQYISTEEEMNRQVFSLLLANRFYASQNATGTTGNTSSTSYIGTTVSELLSNQLSSWISQNKYNLGVGVNYRPGDDVTQEEYELALSTQVLDNKIVLSGNIGYGRSTNESSEGSVIGDFDIEVKLNKKGNLRAKAYTHSNNDVIYETSPTTQGIGISFREDFNSFSELMKRYWQAITRRRGKKTQTDKADQ